jgi:hypothetical protein
MNKIDLSNITLVSVASNKIQQTIKAIDHCLSLCKFKDIIFFSDYDSNRTTKINKINSIAEYDYFMTYEIPKKLVDRSDFILIVHWDGFIVNPTAWTPEFLQYDYVGAPWPWTDYCGNGGFCLRSNKFLRCQMNILDQLVEKKWLTTADDVVLSYTLRKDFIEMGCSYAPKDIAYKFSTEYGSYNDHQSFGFHNLNLHPQFRNIVEA